LLTEVIGLQRLADGALVDIGRHHIERQWRNGMQGKITLENHFAIPETLEGFPYSGKHFWEVLKSRLLDFDDQRLRLMDEAGVELMILSLNAPGIQAMYETDQAVQVARCANDMLAEQVRKRPDRYAGLAALPLQDPEQAAIELQRCTKDYVSKVH
jgi:2,3-dihydroxybenzoate decarboxylase